MAPSIDDPEFYEERENLNEADYNLEESRANQALRNLATLNARRDDRVRAEDLQQALEELQHMTRRTASGMVREEPRPETGDIAVDEEHQMRMYNGDTWTKYLPNEQRIQDIESKLERVIECLKRWDGTGFTARQDLMEGLNSDALKITPERKRRRRIELNDE